MANVPFTRDEVILALDTLYSAGDERLNAESKPIQELSVLLNELPIIPAEKRKANFRSCKGIAQQLSLFRKSFYKGQKDKDVGESFYSTAILFKDDVSYLHEIAEAVRYNKHSFAQFSFGNINEGDDWIEGALLGHLHCAIEKQAELKMPLVASCEVCGLDLSQMYLESAGILTEAHLLVPITQTKADAHYNASDFIMVCPACHKVLHRTRPWLSRQEVHYILR